MLDDLKNEMHRYVKDLEENIKNQEDLDYIKERTAYFIDVVVTEIEKILSYKEDRLVTIIKKQEQNDQLIQELKERVDNVYQDIYEEDNEDFSIICPYCNFEFDAEIDEEFNEIKCPECGNTIELDWNCNPDDEIDGNCGGNCSDCGGCN